MAVDTRAKRQSAHRAANRWARIWPNPDGTIAVADRQHALDFYGGIASTIVAAVLFPPLIADAASRVWRVTAALRGWRIDAPNRSWKTDSE